MIICSVNQDVIDKAAPGEMYRLTTGFRPFEGQVEDLVAHIKQGHAFTSAVLKPNSDGTFTRNNDSFDRAELITLDIDNSVIRPDKTKRKKTVEENYYSFEQCCRSQFVNQYALFAYTTASHTAEHNRFRLVFRLPEVLTSFDQYKEILISFINRTESDMACSDPARTFYGNREADVVIFGGRLTDDVVLNTLNFKARVEFEEKDATARINGQLNEEHVKGMLSKIPPQGDYTDWCKIISAVASRFDAQTTERLIEQWSPGKTGEVAYKIQHRLQKVNFGTLVYYAKNHGWEAPHGFYKPKANKEFPHTDSGNAERFVEAYGETARFEHKAKQWFLWDEKRMKLDETAQVYGLAKATVRKLYAEAANIEDDSMRKNTLAHARKSESAAALGNIISLAGKDKRIASLFDEFDTHHTQINLNNGVFDLKNWLLLKHSPSLYHTKLIPIDYIEGATCPKWLEFLHTVQDNNEEMVNFIQRAIGYSLSGLISEQCMFFAYGTGKNGKSIFFEVMKMLFADYYQKAPTDMLLAKKNEGISNDIARLRGSRFVVASELPENRKFDEARLKDLTGGDRIVARFLHAEFFEFDPTHKLWIYGNHRPNISGTDEGIWRRINIIPFTVTISEEKRRKQEDLLAEFRAELPGILNWAMQGFYFWSQTDENGGLQRPALVASATQSYRDEMDSIGGFISEYTKEEQFSRVKCSQVYEEYVKWAAKTGEFAMKSRSLSSRLKERGWENEKSTDGYYYWLQRVLITPQAGLIDYN